MKTKHIKPGDLLVKGKREDLRDGTGGKTVIALAVGNFTTVRQPCGEVIVPHPRAGRRVAIAEPIKVRRADGRTEVEWRPALATASQLEDGHVWQLKRDAHLEIAEMDRQHEREGQAIVTEMKELLESATACLPLRADDFSVWGSFRHARDGGPGLQLSVKIGDDELMNRIRRHDPISAEKIDELNDRWIEWRRKPVPSTCQR